MYATKRYDPDQDKWFGDMYISALSLDQAQKIGIQYGLIVLGRVVE